MSLPNNNTGQFPTNNGTYGYYCNNCQTWFASGVSHICNTPYYQYYGQGYIDNTILERIAKALEEISIELKKRNN